MMKIPFMDLKRQYESIKPEIDQAIQKIILASEFIGGPEKEKFEKDFAEACGVAGCVGMGNGTDAIYIALMALGIGAGDEVIVPAMTFIATSESVTITGAKPVFVDVDNQTNLIDIELLENVLKTRAHSKGGKVKAIIAVHLYGRMNDMTALKKLAEKYDLKLVEDAAQAHLAEWSGKKAGAYGDATTFSFYPGKNLGAYGDAGAVVSNDREFLIRARKIANHGRISKYDHEIEGFNSRLDGIQAAILNVKLKRLSEWTQKRIDAAMIYDELLGDLGNSAKKPEIPPRGQHVFHLYVLRVKNRERILKSLEAIGIQAIVHYPIALPNLKAYAHMGHKPTDFPVASALQNEVLSLPLFPEITLEEQKYVADNFIKILSE